jgi:hypothetical protein
MSPAGVTILILAGNDATPNAEGDPMKIITSFLAAAALLAGITIAGAQALPTNPPTPQEGGALPPSGD